MTNNLKVTEDVRVFSCGDLENYAIYDTNTKGGRLGKLTLKQAMSLGVSAATCRRV
jgi:hypothetical protein